MGVIAGMLKWAFGVVPGVIATIRKAADISTKSRQLIDAFQRGKEIVNGATPFSQPQRQGVVIERPEFISGHVQTVPSAELNNLAASVQQHRKMLTKVENHNHNEHRRIQLQIDIVELIVSAQTFERFTNNINLHAANLQIHLQSIRNTAGILDGVNRQRVAIKELMRKVNHLMNVAGEEDQKISGIDVDMREGEISIFAAYKAFEHTRNLLLDEIQSFTQSIEDQLDKAEQIRASSISIPGVGENIDRWLTRDIEGRLQEAKQMAKQLGDDLTRIPRLEASLRRRLREDSMLEASPAEA